MYLLIQFVPSSFTKFNFTFNFKFVNGICNGILTNKVDCKQKLKMGSVDVIIEEKKDDSIDRQKVCPFLLRVFVSSTGYHYKPTEYNKGNTPQNELQIYTWRDATLHELTQLVKEVNPEARRKGTKFNFALVFPDMRVPIYRMREIGSTTTGVKGSDDLKTLTQARFAIGDFMDIAITPADSWANNRKGYNNHRQRAY